MRAETIIRSEIARYLKSSLEVSTDIAKWCEYYLNINLYDNQLPIVQAVSNKSISHIGIVGSRQGGKSHSTICGILKTCKDLPGYKWTIWGPKSSQSLRLIEVATEVLRTSRLGKEIDWKKSTGSKLVFENGSGLLALSGDETSEVEGWASSAVCLSGDTKIPLLNGTNTTIKELSEFKDLSNTWVYSIDERQNIVAGKVLKAWKTGTKQTLKITLDNGNTFKCTPDHKIMMRDGSYKEAKDLKENDSLMPLYRHHTKLLKKFNYETVFNPGKNEYEFTHRIIARTLFGEEYKGLIHHRNFNRFNNNPSNLQLCKDGREHKKLHNEGKTWTEILETFGVTYEEWREAIKNRKYDHDKLGKNSQKGWSLLTPEQRDQKIKKTTQILIDYTRNLSVEEKQRQVDQAKKTRAGKTREEIASIAEKRKAGIAKVYAEDPTIRTRRDQSIKLFWESEEGRLGKEQRSIRSSERWNSLSEEEKKQRGVASNKAMCSSLNYKFERVRSWIRTKALNGKKFKPEVLEKYNIILNHKVSKVELFDIIDVYDMTVDQYHNFGITDGIFVHNCIDEAHKVPDSSVRLRILPTLGASKLIKVIKIGMPMYKRHFYQSFHDPKYHKIRFTWKDAQIHFRGGSIWVDGIEYPQTVYDMMPYTIKQKYFPKHPELWTTGELTEFEWNTQYEATWQEDVDLFLDDDGQIKLIGTHEYLDKGNDGETYIAGLDFAGGSLMRGNKLDFTHLSIGALRDKKIELVGSWEWQGDLYKQMGEIIAIIHPTLGKFKCKKILADYGHGAAIVDIMRAKKFPLDAVMYNWKEPKSGKNYKTAIFDKIWTAIKEDRFKFPKNYNKHPVLKKCYDEWTRLERRARVSGNDEICLEGDTKVPLFNGYDKTIKELSELKNWDNLYVYSMKDNQTIVPGKIKRVWKTGTKQTLKVTFDNNEFLICTPDHKIMMRDGSYKEAKDLKENDSVMPLYRRYDVAKLKGYEFIRQFSKKPHWECTHVRSYYESNGHFKLKNNHIHHKDFNKLNNTPSNLILLTRQEHNNLHSVIASGRFKKMWSDPIKKAEILQKQKEGKKLHPYVKGSRKAYNKGISYMEKNCLACDNIFGGPAWKIKRRKFCSPACAMKVKRTDSDQTKLAKSLYRKECWKILTPEQRSIRNKKNWANKSFEERTAIQLKGWETRRKNKLNNHKVVKIESYQVVDVYDIEVESYHNFAIGFNDKSGVFVHNCSPSDFWDDGPNSNALLNFAIDMPFYGMKLDQKRYFPGMQKAEHTDSRFLRQSIDSAQIPQVLKDLLKGDMMD